MKEGYNIKAPTMQDVAKMAGVARSTVSHVIHKSAPISQKTIKKVNAAMKYLAREGRTSKNSMVR